MKFLDRERFCHKGNWTLFIYLYKVVYLTWSTVTLCCWNNIWNSFLGIILRCSGTISRQAPEDNARNISITDGSKVRGEARNTRSSGDILKMDLKT